MRFVLDTSYSEEELQFLREHDCEILSETKLSKTNFSETETPRRIFKYGRTYIAGILDDEAGEPVWAVLTKWKGFYRFSDCYDSLEALEQGL